MLKKLRFLLICILGFVYGACPADITADLFSGFRDMKGAWLGQKEPGLIPRPFLPNMIDYRKHHIHSAPAFSPEGKEMFFSLYIANQFPQRIFHTKMGANGKWSKPELVTFSGTYQDGGPVISPDGKRIYFYSRRPLRAGNAERKESLIFFSNRTLKGWSEARGLQFSKRIGLANYPLYFDRNGFFYFRAKMGKRDYRMFRARIREDQAIAVKSLGSPYIIDPSGQYRLENPIDWMTFGMHFNLASRQADGSWTDFKPMGDTINSRQTQSRFPGFSPDGRFFFFSSYRSGHERLYWISTKFFDICLKRDLNLVDRLFNGFENKTISEIETQISGMRNTLSDCYPFSKELLNEVGYRFLRMGKLSLVKKAFQINFQIFPKSDFLFEKMLISVLFDNRIEGGILRKQLIRERLTRPDLFDRVNYMAYDLMTAGMLQRALMLYRMNCDLFPNISKGFDRLGRIHRRLKSYPEALKAYQKALRLDPDNRSARAGIDHIRKVMKEAQHKKRIRP